MLQVKSILFIPSNTSFKLRNSKWKYNRTNHTKMAESYWQILSLYWSPLLRTPTNQNAQNLMQKWLLIHNL